MTVDTTLTHRSLADTTLADAAAAMARGYEGYFVPINGDPAPLARRMRSEHIDLLESRIYWLDGRPAGLMLVARRGHASRIAAVGFAPELRGRGLGRAALCDAISAARRRGDEALLLEVITENTAALALYEKLGFVRRRRLVGYARPAEASAGSTALTPIPLAAAARRLAAWSDEDLPWQLAPESFSGALPPWQGLALGSEAVVLVDPSSAAVRLGAVAVTPEARRRGVGAQLLAALATLFAGRELAIPAIAPEGLGEGLLSAAGWRRTALSQWEMRLPLAS